MADADRSTDQKQMLAEIIAKLQAETKAIHAGTKAM
jgi:hypothetical protein